MKTSEKGWFKIDRTILDSPVFSNANLFKTYVWCLAKANFKTKHLEIRTGKGTTTVTVKRGSFISGRKRAAEDLQIAGSTYVDHMKKLEKYGLVKVIAKSHYSVIKIIGYPSKKTTNRQVSVTTNKGKKNEK